MHILRNNVNTPPLEGSYVPQTVQLFFAGVFQGIGVQFDDVNGHWPSCDQETQGHRYQSHRHAGHLEI